MDQWNVIETPEIDSHLSRLPIFDRSAKAVQWRKEICINKWCWGIGYPNANKVTWICTSCHMWKLIQHGS